MTNKKFEFRTVQPISIFVRLVCVRLIRMSPFILLFAFSCLPFIKWGLGGIVDPFDAYFPLEPSIFLHSLLSSWDFFGAKFGVFSFAQISLSPLFTLPAFLQLLGLPIELVSRGVFILLTFGSSLAMYFLARMGPSKSSRAGSLIAGTFYSLGPYMAGEIWLGHWLAMFTYVAAPIILLSISKLFESRKWILWSIILSVASVFVLPRLRLLLYFLLTCLALVVFLAISNRRGICSFAKGILFALPLSFLANSYYILPALSNFTGSVVPLANDYSLIEVGFPRTFSNPVNVIGLVGYGVHPELWGKFLTSEFMSLFIIALVLIILYVVLKNRLSFDIFLLTFALLLLLHMLFFVLIPVYRSRFTSLTELIPFPVNLLMFQKDLAYISFPVSCCYALLLASAMDSFSTSRRRYRLIGQFTVMIVVLVISSQLVIPVESDPLRPIFTPAYYQEASEWVSNSTLDFKMADISSRTDGGYSVYSWSPSKLPTSDIIRQMMPVPVIRPPSANDYSESSTILRSAYFSSNSLERQKALEILGVRYLIKRGDVLNSVNYSGLGLMSLSSSFKSGPFEILETASYAPFLLATTGYYLVLGGNSFLSAASMIPFINFSRSAFIFIQEEQLGEMSPADFPRLIITTNATQIEHFQMLDLRNRQVVYLFDSETFYNNISLPNDYRVYGFDTWGRTVSPTNPSRDPRIGNLQNMSGIAEIDKSDSGDTLSFQNDTLYGSQISLNVTERTGFHGIFLYPGKNNWNFTSLETVKGGIALQVYGDGSSSEVRVSLQCANPATRYQWPLQTIRLNWVGWKTLIFPLSDFEQVGEPNLSSISSIALWIENSGGNKSSLVVRGLAKYLGPMAVLAMPSTIDFSDYFSAEVLEMNYTGLLTPRINIELGDSRRAILVLNTAYENGWRALSSSGQYLEHLVSNGYSNAFLINDSDSQNILVIYAPQLFYEIGLVTSTCTISVALFFVVFFVRTRFILIIKRVLGVVFR